jgi:hypothetical protein
MCVCCFDTNAHMTEQSSPPSHPREQLSTQRSWVVSALNLQPLSLHAVFRGTRGIPLLLLCPSLGFRACRGRHANRICGLHEGAATRIAFAVCRFWRDSVCTLRRSKSIGLRVYRLKGPRSRQVPCNQEPTGWRGCLRPNLPQSFPRSRCASSKAPSWPENRWENSTAGHTTGREPSYHPR